MKMEEISMKKILLTSLFSATLLIGGSGVSVFADELVPDDTMTPPIEEPTEPSKPTDPTPPIETPVDPVEPPITPTDPTEPTEPTTPTEPEKPVDPTEPTTPIEPTDPTKPTESSEPEQPSEPSTPAEPEKPVQPTQPEEPAQPKPVEVVVTPGGEITPGTKATQQPTVPIQTANIHEVTAVPTETTPIVTATGESIVAVKEGIPLTQTSQGVQPMAGAYKKLPSGNVSVKTADGKEKVLPYTGEEMNLLVSAAGSILAMVSGLVFYKKRKGNN